MKFTIFILTILILSSCGHGSAGPGCAEAFCVCALDQNKQPYCAYQK